MRYEKWILDHNHQAENQSGVEVITYDCAFLLPLAFPPDLPPVILFGLKEFGAEVRSGRRNQSEVDVRRKTVDVCEELECEQEVVVVVAAAWERVGKEKKRWKLGRARRFIKNAVQPIRSTFSFLISYFFAP